MAIDSAKSKAYDRLELMRDPSHTHALTKEEFITLNQQSGLIDCRQSAYGVDIELETQLQASFPKPGDEPILREMITKDIGVDDFDIKARNDSDKVIYTVPIAVYVGAQA